MIDLTLDAPSAEQALPAPEPWPSDEPTLLDMLDATVARWGPRNAIDASDQELSYAAMAGASDDLAARLAENGVGPGDRVGVRVPSGTAELYVAILGVLRSGAAYVPVDADDPPARADQILSGARACAVVGQGLELTWRGRPAGRTGRPGPDDDAWIIFTSGSTGAPKGVAVTHRSAARFVNAESALWQVVPSDRVLGGLSVAFDASCEEMWLAWAHGAALVPAPRALVRSGVELGPWLSRRRITVISTVPTLAAIWDDSSLREVRLLILGGEPCPEQLAWRLADGREVWNTYGPTEATVVTTAARMRRDVPVTIGLPLPGWQVAVVDDGGQPVTDGEAGELVIAGVGLGRYLDPELDLKRFAALPSLGWARSYRTGDIVRRTPDGLVYVGRRDHQVKIGGRRIELGEIDAVLSDVPGVRRACTVVREATAGNDRLVAYVDGAVDGSAVRDAVAAKLPAGLVPMVVVLDELPVATSGKVDRAALPWPPPYRAASDPSSGGALSETERWLRDRWVDQLGPVAIGPDSDFFALGGSSLAAAKLASELRRRFPALAVADIYDHRRLHELATRLQHLGEARAASEPVPPTGRRCWGVVRLGGVLALLTLTVPQWLIGILALDHLYPGHIGPQLAWGWLIAGWFAFASAPGRVLLVVGARRALLPALQPGRYPRASWLACRVWFLERLATAAHLDQLAGTPWAARYARLCGHRVAAGARLGTLPPTSSQVSIGAGATLEADVDLHGWWIDGHELVIGPVSIGAGARIGTRSLLMPDAAIGDGAEIEPGSVVEGDVPTGERWAGAPARRVGHAGEHWPPSAPAPATWHRRWRLMYGVGVLAPNALALVAAIPGILILDLLAPAAWTARSAALTMITASPLIAASFVASYAIVVALVVRLVSPLIREGWHGDGGATGWALWFTETMMAGARETLFPLFSSVFTRPWLALAGIGVGRRGEVSTATGLNRLVSLDAVSFAADDVAMGTSRARDGWLRVAPIAIGGASFLGNGAIVGGGTSVGDGSLVGLLTTAPARCPAGSSWLGSPALELPRRSRAGDPRRTTDPTRRRVLARAVTELVRILLPATISVVLASLVFDTLAAVGAGYGLWIMAGAAPFVLAIASLCAVAVTIVLKWLVIGRYRAGDHPLWSFFVWRDEIINSCQEQLAGGWLLNSALGTPLICGYLRLMGARVGRDVWCETLTITEFDLAELGDGAVVNRHSVVETHLFHDRVMQLGPTRLGIGSTLGPSSAMLPDSEIGDHCSVGGRSIVMRGERLPDHTRWHGAPVVAA